MIHVLVTNEVVGEALLYPFFSQEGTPTMVPSYRVICTSLTHENKFETAVTRCSSEVVFNGQPDRYATLGECPPSVIGKPFKGSVYQTEKTPFGIKLFERRFGADNLLLGTGAVTRSDIAIHHGPGRSEGCMMIAGGKEAFAVFRENFEQMLKIDSEITVTVQERLI